MSIYNGNKTMKQMLDEKHKYGANTCRSCKRRIVKDWNIYKYNAMCSSECNSKLIHKLLATA